MELVLTGLDIQAEIIERTDLVTEMRCVKHCMDRGVPARTGIEELLIRAKSEYYFIIT